MSIQKLSLPKQTTHSYRMRLSAEQSEEKQKSHETVALPLLLGQGCNFEVNKAKLSNAYLSLTQRQFLANSLGQTHGNRHFQQVMTNANQPSLATFSLSQRVSSTSIQRKCACAGKSNNDNECDECRKKRSSVENFNTEPSIKGVPDYLRSALEQGSKSASHYQQSLQAFRQENHNATLNSYRVGLSEPQTSVSIKEVSPLKQIRRMARAPEPMFCFITRQGGYKTIQAEDREKAKAKFDIRYSPTEFCHDGACQNENGLWDPNDNECE